MNQLHRYAFFFCFVVLFFRQPETFRASQNQLARQKPGDFSPKSKNLEKSQIIKSLKCMKESSRKKMGRKPKADPAIHRYGIKLTNEENVRFEAAFSESGMKEKAGFIKKSIFGGRIKVVKIDKATMDYYIKLTEFHRQFQAVGNNYNQVVRTLKNNFGEKRAMALLYRLEKLSIELMLVCKKVIVLTQEYERKWLQK
jgi:hypothetical protein